MVWGLVPNHEHDEGEGKEMELFRIFYRAMKGPSKFCVVKAVGGWDATVAERSVLFPRTANARKTFCHGADCAPQRFQSSGFPHLHRPCWKQGSKIQLQESLLRYWTLDRGSDALWTAAAPDIARMPRAPDKFHLLGLGVRKAFFLVGNEWLEELSSSFEWETEKSIRNTLPDEVVVRYNNPRVDGLTLLNSKLTQTQQSGGISL